MATRSWLFLVCTTIAMLALPGLASAAQSNGSYFPCTDSFAKEVAIDSGFVTAANRTTQNHYDNPRYWKAAQTVCADFDGDGNDEMVTSLASMGGTEPWAFFDVPLGKAAEATYAFPTISGYSGPPYANHTLELVWVEGQPAIRDKRRLFRRRDAHCCPTGGTFVRLVGFSEGSYSVLESETHRARAPAKKHKARVSQGLARSAAATFLGQRYGEAWYNRAGGRLKCNRRLAFNQRKCDISFVIGDTGWVGTVRISYLEQDSTSRWARAGFRVSRINEYCAFVEHGSRAECVHDEHGRTRFFRF